MGRKYRIGVMPGDGVGPEVVGVAVRVLRELLPEAELVEIGAGYEFMKRTGKPLEDGALDVIRSVDAVIKGPLATPPGPGTIKSINVYLRRELGLYANVRPFRSFRGISLGEFDFVIVRENTEGLYSGVEGRAGDAAFAVRVVTRRGCERVVEFALSYAARRGYARVTAVHKANILKETDGLFREVFFDAARRYPGIRADEMYVDAAAYSLVRDPGSFGVIVTPNLYGDILSDEAAALVGSLGLCGSAQIGDDAAIFEPVHGTAPDIAGKRIANPAGELTALALMLEYMGERRGDRRLVAISRALSEAIRRVIEGRKALTPDLGGTSTTDSFGETVLSEVKTLLGQG